MQRDSNKSKLTGVNKRRNQTISKIKYTIKEETNKQIDEEIKEI